MRDQAQELLLRWHLHKDLRAAAEVFVLLKQEWAPRVARFLHRSTDDPDTEQVLSDLLIELLVPADGRPPRALAPDDHERPDLWRSRVLTNALINHYRRQKAYSSATQAAAYELTAAARRELRDAGQPISALPRPSAEVANVEDIVALRQMREAVVVRLPRLKVRRRVALALALAMDITPWLTELAGDLGEPVSQVRRRAAAAWQRPDASEEKIRVLQPDQDLAQAQDAFRKLVHCAAEDMKRLLHGGLA
jgi:hypothetical protein